jgi:hypothetical protein
VSSLTRSVGERTREVGGVDEVRGLSGGRGRLGSRGHSVREPPSWSEKVAVSAASQLERIEDELKSEKKGRRFASHGKVK